VVLNGPKP